jgi:DNA polymerase-3 subunit gamma/tau
VTANESSYLVSARKWRPMVFEDVVGQEHVTTTLRNAIATNRLSHAYLFSGPRGVGKTTTARILAKAINCLHPAGTDPDNACDICVEITEGRSLNVFEIDGASNRGVDEIRNLREAIRYGPQKGRYKVYIIDEVHMLTKEAFNALLKTLEEPPPSILFVFATTEIHKVPLTILSRCQRFDFRRIATDEIVKRLRLIADSDSVAIDDDALLLIARRGDGSLRDALSAFDQVASFCQGTITSEQIATMLNVVDEELYFRLTGCISAKDVKDGLALVEEIVTRGFDLREFLAGLTEHFRNLLVVRATQSTRLVETSEQNRKRYADMASAFTEQDLLRLIKIAADTDSAIRWSQTSGGGRFKLEIGIVQMIRLDRSIEIGQLLAKLEDVKKKLNGTSSVSNFPGVDDSASAAPTKPLPVRSDTPIRGSVKATPPTLYPEQIVAGSTASSRVNDHTIPKNPSAEVEMPLAANTVSSAASEITNDEARSKWKSFVEEARRRRIAIGTMLSETTILGVKDNQIQIGCPDDFHLDTLKRNRQFITELAQQMYGARVRLETVLTNQSAPATVPSVSSSRSSGNSDVRNHPIVQALIRDFGAQEVE